MPHQRMAMSSPKDVLFPMLNRPPNSDFSFKFKWLIAVEQVHTPSAHGESPPSPTHKRGGQDQGAVVHPGWRSSRLRQDGAAIFDALHRHGTVRAAIPQAFDLLELNGEDLRPVMLGKRKARLARLLARAPPGIEFKRAYRR
jgi:hypothetical protein